jgi:hypothetical protein
MSEHIYKTLLINTCHLPSGDAAKPYATIDHEFGYIFMDIGSFMKNILSPEQYASVPWLFYAALLCSREGCTILQYDADAPVHPELIKYDW